MVSIMGPRLLPRSVSEYSTLGGISLYAVRLTRPSASMSLRLAERTFCDTPARESFSSPNLLVPVSRSLMISTFHLLPITDSVSSTGHAGRSWVICGGRGLPPFEVWPRRCGKNIPAVMSR